MRSEPKKNSAYESPLVTRTNRIKKGNLSERSEFVSLPDLCVASTGTSRSEATNRGRLSLLTFLWRSKESERLPGRPRQGRSKKEKNNREQNENFRQKPQNYDYPLAGPTPSTHPAHQANPPTQKQY
jgi:hypothetical protein